MIQYNVFPGAKKRIVTFSYDDGPQSDERLVELFSRYQVKGSFHLNSGCFLPFDQQQADLLRQRYVGHEISCHTKRHGWPSLIPATSLVNEVLEDRKVLESIAQTPVIGMSYPSGDFDNASIAVMQSCGIVYGRTTHDTNDFKLPTDFMRWDPTCHHDGAKQNIERFLKNLTSPWYGPLLYIWGHSHEWKEEAQWQAFEENLKRIAFNDSIWYATNLEIYQYIQAQRSLVISADETMIYNPSAMTVFVEKDKREILEIAPGQLYQC